MKNTGTVYLVGRYFGSHPEINGKGKLKITACEQGVTVSYKKTIIRRFAWFEITGFEVNDDTQEQSSQRLTATRLVGLGVFALAVPKKSSNIRIKLTYSLTTKGGTLELHYETENAVRLTLKALEKNVNTFKAMALRLITAQPELTMQPIVENDADQIMKFAELKEKGIITQAEFDKKKKELLG